RCERVRQPCKTILIHRCEHPRITRQREAAGLGNCNCSIELADRRLDHHGIWLELWRRDRIKRQLLCSDERRVEVEAEISVRNALHELADGTRAPRAR